ncbi:MAG: carboxypeptidase-like regulatory domain-containing protein [Deltaproteobacteria bacterium]|nr:carboxypeptidase-like regulatory domain-containing protein [Deltaproteobacteria bacterium]
MRAFLIAIAVCLGACHAQPRRITTGAIAGLCRDQSTGTPVASATLSLARDGALTSTSVASGIDGDYRIEGLAPGRYDLSATYAGQIVQITHIDVAIGVTVEVDVEFALGEPGTHHIDFGDAHEGDLRSYRPLSADPETGVLEGTVTDAASRERAIGSVVTATGPGGAISQVVTDEHGRFVVPRLAPGTYAVSAYYTVAGHGTIEIKRLAVPVRAGETVVVPLFVELQQ